MGITKHKAWAATGATLVLASCAPKAVVVEETPQPKVEQKTKPAESTVPQEPVLPLPDDGLRMPDMLALPGDSEFRSNRPAVPRSGGDGGGVIARPPTDPPSRVKPQPAEQE